MNLNRNDIELLIDQKYIMMNKHPELDLYILNYTKTAQFERYWNEYTLMARGLVINKDFNVVARPFKKFFNIEEHNTEEIPYGLPFEVFDKMDGSLGIIFYYNNEWHVATRGSFISDQAKRGKQLFDVKYYAGQLNLDERYTYLVEIIYPENRIVVDYRGMSDLVLLAAINTKTGDELSYDMLSSVGFTVVKKYDNVKDVDSIRTLFENNTDEGVIVRFSNGFRLKIKWNEYCRLHSIVTNVSTKIVWEHLKNENSFEELLENVPDEFYDWINKTSDNIRSEYSKIELKFFKIFYDLYISKNLRTKKEFALEAIKYSPSSILFNMFDGKKYDHIIWSMVEPEFAKPFGDY